MESFTVEVTRLIHSSPTGWTVFEAELFPLEESGQPPAFLVQKRIGTFTGDLSDLEPRVGDVLLVAGDTTSHPKFGPQIKLQLATRIIVASERVWTAFLASLPNIGRYRASKILRKWPDLKELETVLRNTPEALVAIDGITAPRAQLIHQEFLRHENRFKSFTYLAKLNVLEPHLLTRIALHFKHVDIQALIEKDPFNLMDVHGITFKHATSVADKLEIPKDDPRRQAAALIHVLQTLTLSGSTVATTTELQTNLDTRRAILETGFDTDDFEKAIDYCKSTEPPRVYLTPKGIGLPRYVNAEYTIAKRLLDKTVPIE